MVEAGECGREGVLWCSTAGQLRSIRLFDVGSSSEVVSYWESVVDVVERGELERWLEGQRRVGPQRVSGS